eukprot:scpid99075/ scgid13936/ 
MLVVNKSVFVLSHNGLLRGIRLTQHGGSCGFYDCRKEPFASSPQSSIPSSGTVSSSSSSCVVVVSLRSLVVSPVMPGMHYALLVSSYSWTLLFSSSHATAPCLC